MRKLYLRMLNIVLAILRVVVRGYYPILLGYKHVPKSRWGHGNPPHKELYELLNSGREHYRETLHSFQKYEDRLSQISMDEPDSAEEPYWLNGWVPALDGLAIYGFTSNLKPNRYVEIGSGNSTKFAKRAIRDHGLETRITSIDPYPRAEINALCNTIIRQPIEDTDLKLFEELEADDVLYVDGSHYCLQNSDVTVIFTEILPKLKSGVIVQLHDIFLPYDYHPVWKERYYSEQYMLATALLLGDRFEVMLPNAFITEDDELIEITTPLMDSLKMPLNQRHGGSFWLKVK